MNTLFIDTSDNKNLVVSINKEGKKDELKSDGKSVRSQLVLPYINTLLKRNDLKLKDLNKIEVNSGPGSFTGLRVGIAIANTLSFFLGIPLNGRKVGELEEAKYN